MGELGGFSAPGVRQPDMPVIPVLLGVYRREDEGNLLPIRGDLGIGYEFESAKILDGNFTLRHDVNLVYRKLRLVRHLASSVKPFSDDFQADD